MNEQQRKAMEQALEALKNITNYEGLADAREAIKEALAQPPVPTAQPNLEKIADDLQELCDKQALRIGALEAQLAQPKEPEQEPVAWMRTSGTGSPVVTEALLVEMPEMRWNFQQPLYTTPYVATPRPQRSEASKPLTDAQIDELRSGYQSGRIGSFVALARAIEAAHGIKE